MYGLWGIIIVTLTVFATWRLASRRHTHPCPVRLRWLIELDNPFTRTNRAAVIVDHLGITPGMSVLGMGCGPGRVSVPAAEKAGKREGFERALLVAVLGEIPDRDSAMKEIFDALKAGGVLSITEIIFDPHFQRRSAVKKLAERIGFRENEFFGNAIAYAMHFEKPMADRAINPCSSK